MLNFKTLVAAAVLSSVAAVSFAQAPAAPKAAPITPTATAPSVAVADGGMTAKPAAKKAHAVKKVKHVKASKGTAVKPAVAVGK
jgi:hypothetical protein